MTMEYGPAPEDPGEAPAWLDRHGRRFGHFINGASHAPAARTYFDTMDPSTGEKLATVAQGSAADVDSAVKAARGALPTWQSLTNHAHARYHHPLGQPGQHPSPLLALPPTPEQGQPSP